MSRMVQAAIPKGGPARPVHSKRSNAVALATRLATNVKVRRHATTLSTAPATVWIMQPVG